MSLLDTISAVRQETEALAETPFAPAPNTSFSTVNPALQIAWDSSAYNDLCKCPRYYQLAHVLGYASPYENDHLKFGTVFHGATEVYDKAKAAGLDHATAAKSALRHALTETWDSNRSRPWASEEPTKTRNTVLRTIVTYLDKFQDDNFKTMILANGNPAIELSFRFPLGISAPTDEPYLLCGHMDRVVEWNDSVWITDKKTTKSELDDNYFRAFTPDNQVSLYSLAGQVILSREVSGMIIDACQVQVTGNRFRRRHIERTPDQITEWLKDLTFRLKEAETYAEHSHWPMNSKACGFGRFQCTFRPVCSADPSARDEMLETFYTKRTWDPLQVR